MYLNKYKKKNTDYIGKYLYWDGMRFKIEDFDKSTCRYELLGAPVKNPEAVGWATIDMRELRRLAIKGMVKEC